MSKTKPVWRQLTVVFLLALGLAVSMALFFLARQWEWSQLETDFHEYARKRVEWLEESLDRDLTFLRSLQAFYAASQAVEPGEFRAFVSSILDRQPELLALEWVARVPHAEREQFETAMQAQGHPQFRMTERDPQAGQVVPASERPDYFPSTFVEPLEPNVKILGFDHGSLPSRRAAMDQARDTGALATTSFEPLFRMETPNDRYGLLVLVPIYRNGVPTDTVEQRRAHLAGFAMAVFQIDELLQVSLDRSRSRGIAVSLYEDTPTHVPAAGVRVVTPPAEPMKAWFLPGAKPLVRRTTLEIGSRRWVVECTPTAEFFGLHEHREIWLNFWLSLLLLVVLWGYLLTFLRRHVRMQRLVAARTAELSRANRALEQEITERRQLQQQESANSEVLHSTNRQLEQQQEATRRLLADLQRSKGQVEATNQELSRRERITQSLLDDLKTAKERIEQQATTLLSTNTKLKELATLKDEFVAKVSHELRTPLTSIKEGLSLILDGALGDTTPDQQDFLRTIDGDIDRLTEMINNMLDISKIEAGRMHLVRARLDLRTVLKSLIRSYQPILGRRRVETECAEEPLVFADHNRLTQVFTNLLSNAMKFTAEDGAITFQIERRDGMVAVAVRDNGPGIAPQDLPKLFQKFSQLGQQPGRPRGTGLGLVVCKELTELHGGRIEVASEMERGTTFTVLLPAYTDTLALQESFRQLLDSVSHEADPHCGLVAIEATACIEQGARGPARQAALDHLTDEVRRFLHRGDLVLALEPAWLVVLAVADAEGIAAISARLQRSLPSGDRLRIGTALYPADGEEAEQLFAQASARAQQGGR